MVSTSSRKCYRRSASHEHPSLQFQSTYTHRHSSHSWVSGWTRAHAFPAQAWVANDQKPVSWPTYNMNWVFFVWSSLDVPVVADATSIPSIICTISVCKMGCTSLSLSSLFRSLYQRNDSTISCASARHLGPSMWAAKTWPQDGNRHNVDIEGCFCQDLSHTGL